MIQKRRNQLRVAFHIDVIFNLVLLSIFLFVRNLNLFAYLVIIFNLIYAYGAFKLDSTINYWVSVRLDYIDTILIKWILKNINRRNYRFLKNFLPHSEHNVVIFDLPLPINTSKFKNEENSDESWNKISEEDFDPFHIHKTTLDLAQQLIQNEKALTEDELERLYAEGSYKERELLEIHLPPDHPILLKIDEKLKIEISNGLTILK